MSFYPDLIQETEPTELYVKKKQVYCNCNCKWIVDAGHITE